MRLINVHTFELHTFTDVQSPPYVALSHRWTRNEISYEEYIDPERRHGSGYEKVLRACHFIASWKGRDGAEPIGWLWIDTACIDKRSSAELSEAINSMARWYAECAYCLAYLSDVPPLIPPVSEGLKTFLQSFERSEWFRRGWTLQELLMPQQVVFCNSEWGLFGYKRAMPLRNINGPSVLCNLISKITSIPEPVLQDTRLIHRQSVARRMSWAARRVTTRPEDAAYCLLGIFRINMPLLYGEGNNAFQRLQQEIIKQSDDESIFAWTSGDFRWRERWSLLANYPSQFLSCGDVHRIQLVRRPLYRVTNQYLEFRSKAVRLALGNGNIYIVELNCCIAPGLPVYGDVEPVLARNYEASACLIALHESEDGIFRRVLHGGGGAELVAHVKRICPRADISVVEDKHFDIVLTNASKEPALVLRPQLLPTLTRLEGMFETMTTEASEGDGEDLNFHPSQTMRIHQEDEWV